MLIKRYIFEATPNELQHILVVLLSNAKDILELREIIYLKIVITMSQKHGWYQLYICDNGGG